MTRLADAPQNQRTQLTLFVPEPTAATLEQVRRRLDPVQHALIRAHVTFCREDEFSDDMVDDVRDRIGAAGCGPIELRFGAPQRFADFGVLLPCIDGADQYHALRRVALARSDLRLPEPHITLAHPRNHRAVPAGAFAADLEGPITIQFGEIAVIRQIGTQPWGGLAAIPL